MISKNNKPLYGKSLKKSLGKWGVIHYKWLSKDQYIWGRVTNIESGYIWITTYRFYKSHKYYHEITLQIKEVKVFIPIRGIPEYLLKP